MAVVLENVEYNEQLSTLSEICPSALDSATE
jgi:hypothetical protein